MKLKAEVADAVRRLKGVYPVTVWVRPVELQTALEVQVSGTPVLSCRLTEDNEFTVRQVATVEVSTKALRHILDSVIEQMDLPGDRT